MQIREQVPLAELTTMRLGGAARYVITVTTPDEVPEAYAFAAARDLPVYVLGSGANTLGRDEGYPGVVLLCRIPGQQFLRPDGGELTPEAAADAAESGTEVWLKVGAGEIWDDVCATACAAGLSGIEAMSLIPGTAGAAPVQNIGAYGQEIADVLVALTAYDTQTQTQVVLRSAELAFGYRTSLFNTSARGRYVILDLTLRLRRTQLQPPLYASLQSYLDEHGVQDLTPAAVRAAVVAIRRGKLPDATEQASAGSFFKNIVIKTEAEKHAAEAQGIPVFGEPGNWSLSSGWLIEHAGLKGKLLHGMRVCPTAALVLINESARSYADLAAARAEIQAAVKEKFGYELEQEPEELVPPAPPLA